MNERDHLKEELVVPYVDGRLGEVERATLERHLSVCAECRARIEELRRVFAVLGEWRGVEPSPAFLAHVGARLEAEKKAPAWPWRWVYASAAAVAAVALLIFFIQPPTPRPGTQTTPSVATPEDDLAEVEPVVLENFDLLRDFDILFDSAEKKESPRREG